MLFSWWRPDDSGIIILRELQPSEDYSDLDDIAHMLVDMLNTEAMTSAWVSYSNIADDLKQLPDAYKEARTALEVGKIFYTGKNVFGYNRLGIGRFDLSAAGGDLRDVYR